MTFETEYAKQLYKLYDEVDDEDDDEEDDDEKSDREQEEEDEEVYILQWKGKSSR